MARTRICDSAKVELFNAAHGPNATVMPMHGFAKALVSNAVTYTTPVATGVSWASAPFTVAGLLVSKRQAK